MKKSNTTLFWVLIATVLLLGGAIIYSLNQADSSDEAATGDQTSETSDPAPQENTSDNQQAEEPAQSESLVIDGVDIPNSVLAQIERDYPDYIIDEADREVRGGEVYYEIELEHRTPSNESEYELTYNENWELIDTKFESS